MGKNETPEKKHDGQSSKDEKNYMATGMALGMSFGSMLGAVLMTTFGIIALSYCFLGGMIMGMLIGMNIKKKGN